MGNIIIAITLKSENPVAHRCQHPLPLECFISSAFCKHSLSLCWRLPPASRASAKIFAPAAAAAAAASKQQASRKQQPAFAPLKE